MHLIIADCRTSIPLHDIHSRVTHLVIVICETNIRDVPTPAEILVYDNTSVMVLETYSTYVCMQLAL